MSPGETVKFRQYDGLFERYVDGEGVLLNNIWGKLWRIIAKGQPGFADGVVQIHEDDIKAISC